MKESIRNYVETLLGILTQVKRRNSIFTYTQAAQGALQLKYTL